MSGEALHFGFGLRTPKFRNQIPHERIVAKQFRAFARSLADAEGRFSLDVALVRKDRCNRVDGTGATLERQPRLAIGGHAGKHIVRSRRRRVVIDALILGTSRTGSRKPKDEAYARDRFRPGHAPRPHGIRA